MKMLILSYFALALWLVFSLIAVLVLLSQNISSPSVFGFASLLLNAWIAWLAYTNIVDIGKCRDMMNMQQY